MATDCADDEKANVLDVIRGKTWHKWHKTVVSNNTMPTLTDICLHGKIITCTIKLNASATSPEINKVDLTKNAYEEQTVLVPEWDTLHQFGRPFKEMWLSEITLPYRSLQLSQ